MDFEAKSIANLIVIVNVPVITGKGLFTFYNNINVIFRQDQNARF